MFLVLAAILVILWVCFALLIKLTGILVNLFLICAAISIILHFVVRRKPA